MPSGVYPRTEKHSFNKGKKHPNRKHYAKGITPIQKICPSCTSPFTTNCFYPKKKYCSKSCIPKSPNLTKLGKNGSEKQREMMRSRRKELHPNWKGGRSYGYKTGYYSTEYKQWRISVFERDGYKCQGCGIIGTYLTAHHVKSFAHYPELRFVLENGITLCEPCHSLTDNYKGRNKGEKRLN